VVVNLTWITSGDSTSLHKTPYVIRNQDLLMYNNHFKLFMQSGDTTSLHETLYAIRNQDLSMYNNHFEHHHPSPVNYTEWYNKEINHSILYHLTVSKSNG